MTDKHIPTLDRQVAQSRKVKALTAENARLAAEIARITESEQQLLDLLVNGSAAMGKLSGEAHDEACRRVAGENARLREALEDICLITCNQSAFMRAEQCQNIAAEALALRDGAGEK